jgi:twitching motility protein PilT
MRRKVSFEEGDGRHSVHQFIEDARERQATDIHIVANAPILYRLGGELKPVTKGRLTPELSERLSMELLTEKQRAELAETLDLDFMYADSEGRYRINVSYNDGAVGLVIRILPERPRTLDELCLPPAVRYLAHRRKGLVLITGSTSQGKTTTLSAMVDEINENFRRHIVTIEDPIEYVHTNKKGVVRQREVGRDTKDFYNGLRAALRQDPDVLAIGEMRDYESIRIALTAAETGVLVLSTLHIISIDKLIERLISYAPPEEETHMRYLLAGALEGIIHQELLPAADGGKRVAVEVMLATGAARNVIRRRGSFYLSNIIATGTKHGMQTMQQAVAQLLEEGAIEEDVAESVLSSYTS